jgi:hypothetical protein
MKKYQFKKLAKAKRITIKRMRIEFEKLKNRRDEIEKHL